MTLQVLLRIPALEEIWQHAIKLIMKYDLTGASMVPD